MLPDGTEGPDSLHVILMAQHQQQLDVAIQLADSLVAAVKEDWESRQKAAAAAPPPAPRPPPPTPQQFTVNVIF